MQDFREIVGITPGLEQPLSNYLTGLTERAKAVLNEAIIPRDKIDERVVRFEESIHELNKQRAESYGLKYTQPQILYLDRFATEGAIDKIRDEIKGTEDEKYFSTCLESPAMFLQLPNTVIVFMNRFDDKEIDAYFTAKVLRHELAHAGSVQKMKARLDGNQSATIGQYRVGAMTFSSKRDFTAGEAVTEGHNSIEDVLMDQESDDLFYQLKADRFIDPKQKISKLFNKGHQAYRELRNKLIKNIQLHEDELLSGYRSGDNIEHIISNKPHDEFRELMRFIYDKEPGLYQAVEDLIYGDKFIAFAKAITKRFGEGFFKKLMMIADPEQALSLTKELKNIN